MSALTAALLLATPALAAQDAGNLAGMRSPDLVDLTEVDNRLVRRFPSSVAIRIGTLVDSLRAEGLPTEPIVLRALEGGAKRVPADRIHQALVRLADGMRRAKTALGETASDGELTTAGSALQEGVSSASLMELRSLRAGRSLSVPLGAYLDLVARGAVRQRAWETIVRLARSDAADRDYGRIDPTELIARREGDRR